MDIWVKIGILALIVLVAGGLLGFAARRFDRYIFVICVIVPATLQAQLPMLKMNVERWDWPDSVRTMQVYELRFDDLVEGQDSVNQLFLKQSIYFQPDSTWQPVEFVFDSVIGRGDGRQVLLTIVSRWTVLPTGTTYGGMYALAPQLPPTLPGTPSDTAEYVGYRRYNTRGDSLTGLGSWLTYTTRMFPGHQWLSHFTRGNWRTVDFAMWSDQTVIEVTYSLIKVVGLGAQSRAILQFHASRKPIYERRWWAQRDTL